MNNKNHRKITIFQYNKVSEGNNEKQREIIKKYPISVKKGDNYDITE